MINTLSKYKIISFDVFDTAVTRTTADPKGLFNLIKKEIIKSNIFIPIELLDNFLNIRVSSERFVRRDKLSEDITILQIYNYIGRKFSLSDKTIKLLIDIEIQEEMKSIRVVKGTLKLINHLRAGGCRIIFISDMYLPYNVIRMVLEKHGLFKDGDRLYLSNEVGASKKTGNLFKRVVDAERCDPSEIVHVGDNYLSDTVMVGKSISARSLHARDCHHSRYEKILKKSTVSEFDLSGQLLAGASRLARLELYDDLEERRQSLHEIGANVLGPVLYLFIHWLLRSATERGMKRLYFLSRDGEIMLQVARKIAQLNGMTIDLKYLYVSRQALFVPSFIDLSDTEIGWVMQRDPMLSIELVAERLAVDSDVFYLMLVAAGFTALDSKQELSDRQIQHLRKILNENEDLREVVFSKSVELRESVLGYLKQEGLLDSDSWAVVDCGWNGRLQHAIQGILSSTGWLEETRGYYFGLLDKYNLKGNKEGFLFSPENPGYSTWCRPFTFIFEMLTTADHGIVKSYSANTFGEYIPVLSEHNNSNLCNDVKALRAGVHDFLDHIIPDHIDCDKTDSSNKAFQILKAFYLKPSKAEAEALGGLCFAHDQTDSFKYMFAPPMNFKDVCKFSANFFNNKKYAQTFWIHGSRVQSNLISRSVLSLLGFLYYLLNTLYVKMKYLK